VYHALLFFHVLAAFFLAGAVVMYSAFVLGSPVNRTTRLIAEILWGVGGLGTLALGIWLALNRPEYEIWDGWIVTAIVLWLAATGIGSQVSAAIRPTGGDSPIAVDRRIVVMHWVRALLVVAILAVMVWKPGA
jgi:uncharacterized membrane protein